MATFNSPFIKSRTIPTGGPGKNTGTPETPSTAGATSTGGATGDVANKAYSPTLGQRFSNGSTNYQTIYNDPAGRRSVIKDNTGAQYLIPHDKLQRLIGNTQGTLDLNGVRKFSDREAEYFTKNTRGGQHFVDAGTEAAAQHQADASWGAYARSQRPTGAYHGDSSKATRILDRNQPARPNATTYYPVSRSYKKGGVVVKSESDAEVIPGKMIKKGKTTKVKLVAKKSACGGKLKKMVGGKMINKANDCGCN